MEKDISQHHQYLQKNMKMKSERTVERFDIIYVNLGSIEAQLSKQDQIAWIFASHDRVSFVYKVGAIAVSMSFVSRSHPEMIKRLMEQGNPKFMTELCGNHERVGKQAIGLKVAVRSHNLMWMPSVQSSDAVNLISKKITSKFHPAKYDPKSGRMVPTEKHLTSSG